MDVTSVHRAAYRAARERVIADWPKDWYRSLMGDRMPPPVTAGDRSSAVDVHQLRAGHWSGSHQYLQFSGLEATQQTPASSAPTSTALRAGASCAERRPTPHNTSSSAAWPSQDGAFSGWTPVARCCRMSVRTERWRPWRPP